ncbi:MAG: CBS domain-containing protein [Deltaproteobacteria bacterium]
MRRDVKTIQGDMAFKKLREFVSQSKFNSFPLVDARSRLIGILSLSDCRKPFDQDSEKTLTAQDIATRQVVTVTEDDTLFLALTRIVQGDFSILPVVDKKNPTLLLGAISRRDIMSTYDDIVIKKVVRDSSAA